MNCGTACMDPTHYVKCGLCGSIYHVGLAHTCLTAPVQPQLLLVGFP